MANSTASNYYPSRFIDGTDATDYQESIAPLLSLVADAVEEWEEHEIECGTKDREQIQPTLELL